MKPTPPPFRRVLVVSALTGLMLGSVGCDRGWRDSPYPAAPSHVQGTPAPAPRYQGNPTQARSVVVAPGDTVYSVSRRLGVPTRAIILANGLEPPFEVRPGQVLTLPAQRVHTVAPDETLYALSRRYGPSVAAIANANGLAPPYVIRVGESLVIPAASEPEPVDVRPAVFPNQMAAAPPPPAPTLPSAAQARRAVPGAEPPPRAGDLFLWPVDGEIIAGFGPDDAGRHNDGVDIGAPAGTPIRAAENGVVTYIGDAIPGYGTLVLIRHADGWVTAYGHTAAPRVERGQVVRRGQPLGETGQTTATGRPMVHFEIRRDGRPVDPRPRLKPRA
ncbi:LysM peptidoglycan-binding domain-containing M23 family metallopeptidase [Rhodospira trueperi]|uniref:Murein DD-endopeptidase MepM and murein hydrolase activator NlpD, contain LysM domain n=1 Tax=Rhodospira trueperi TaxID=69960 RepID=A0A1G6WIN9_9PROT|nr:LysM peptidoglycan-binding domain-containing M23 family metallopeptidase [Rhodospira trueperi]SDD65820.1 Murein DD-endopeptidase MepM and murein hydrolase activator NlpD, contain LysM domain [Rhodospira trueperi]